MTSASTEVVVMWAAVTAYALAAFLFIIGLVFRRAALGTAATWVTLAGLLAHAVGIAVRWSAVGHGPYLGFYEVASSYAFISVAGYLAVVWRYRPAAPVGVVVTPGAFLLLGASMLASKSGMEVTGKLASWWLFIHVSFAKVAYMSFIVACVVALAYLMREKWTTGPVGELLGKLPSQAALDDISFRFVAIGFIFLAIMIVAGAIWANEAWGRYWGWDAIETWSLVTWIIYAIYLHLRLTMGWRGRKSAWFAVLALPVMLFTLVGVPVLYASIHAAYLGGL